jgi:hypothetical protein
VAGCWLAGWLGSADQGLVFAPVRKKHIFLEKIENL